MFTHKSGALIQRIGFTILEVMIASGVLGIGCLGVLAMLTTAQENNDVSLSRTQATVIAELYISAINAEAMSVNDVGGINLANTPMLQSFRTAPAARWTSLGVVNTVGQVNNGAAVMAANSPLLYCMGYFPRHIAGADALFTGALRIFWRRNGTAMTAGDCNANNLTALDRLGTRNQGAAANFEFITLPYSFFIGQRREEINLGMR